MKEYEHLNESTRRVAALPGEERIQQLRRVRWITYTRAEQIQDRLNDLLTHPKTHRMPCLLLVGATNNGKTAIVNRFEQLHPAADQPDKESVHVPVLTVQAPGGEPFLHEHPRFDRGAVPAKRIGRTTAGTGPESTAGRTAPHADHR